MNPGHPEQPREARRVEGATFVLLALVCFLPGTAFAQETGGALDPESYVALSADDDAQLTLGGFRRYLERTRSYDQQLYRQLDPRLRGLEERELAADVIFWTATGLSIAALVTAIPV